MPRTDTTPGTFVADFPYTVDVIEGLPTGVTAFVGTTLKGPANLPTPIDSFATFTADFGGLHPSSDLSYAVKHFFENGGQMAWIVRIEGAEGGAPSTAEIIGSEEPKTGLQTLQSHGAFDVLLVPNRSESEIHAAMIKLAENFRLFAILDLPEDVRDPASAEVWLANNETLRSPFAAAYFPRVVAEDPAQGIRRSFANSGLVAGVYARTDEAKGVWEAPAGAAATLNGIHRLDYKLNEQEIARLNPLGLNVLRTMPRAGSKIWGARTLGGEGLRLPQRKYVPVSRLIMSMERTIHQYVSWEVERPYHEETCTAVSKQLDLYLRRLFFQGAIHGSTPRGAYDVDCSIYDEAIQVSIGFAPLRTLERIMIVMRGEAPFI